MRYFLTLLGIACLILAVPPAATAQKKAKAVKKKIKRDKNKGAGTQSDLDALNENATEDEAYEQYMKKMEKKAKKKRKKQKIDQKRAARKAAKRRRKAARRVKRNKNNYGANNNKGFPWIF